MDLPDSDRGDISCQRAVTSSSYYDEDDCNNAKFIKYNESFSFWHLNIRSMKQNLQTFTNYLSQLNHRFSIIGVSETRLTDATADLFIAVPHSVKLEQ